MSNPSISEIFQQEFKRKCASLIETGFRKVKESGNYALDWEEERFTEELYLIMDDAVESLDYPYMDVDFENHEISAATEELVRVDFKVKRATEENNIYGYMECKLLSTDTQSLYKYRRNGVLRFISGKYAGRPDTEYGFMVGYIIEKGIDDILSRLTALIEDDNELNTSDAPSCHRNEDDLRIYRSVHNRLNGLGQISLTHIFCDFS